MEMLFEVVKNGLNLRSALQEFPLAFGHDLFALLVMWRHHKDSTPQLVQFLVQGAAVTGVTNRHFGVLVDEVRDGPAVMSERVAEDVGTDMPVVVDGQMQLEAVVFALPVVAGAGVASGYAVPFASH